MNNYIKNETKNKFTIYWSARYVFHKHQETVCILNKPVEFDTHITYPMLKEWLSTKNRWLPNDWKEIRDGRWFSKRIQCKYRTSKGNYIDLPFDGCGLTVQEKQDIDVAFRQWIKEVDKSYEHSKRRHL